MKALVTGGAGFIGSHIVDLLVSKNHEVTIVDNLATGRLKNLSSHLQNNEVHFFNADICDIDQIRPAFQGIDWVFHLAGLADIVPSIEKPNAYFNTNVLGTVNVLEAARNCQAKRFIYAASSSSYGIPDSYPTHESCPIKPQYPYALTKYMGEELVLHWTQIYKLPALSLRLFNVFGIRSRTSGAYGAVFGVFLTQKLNERPFTVVGDGTQTRDFTYVTDVARAFLLAAESSATGEAMNVGSGNCYSINYLVSLLGGCVEYIPKRPGEPDCTFADTSKIKLVLGWSPETSFEEGVANMLKSINDWKDAPVWDSSSIRKATQAWFQYLEDKGKKR